jgi:hypothetical protein
MKSCVFYIFPSIALLGLLSGCVGPLEQAEPSSSASFIEGELEACTSFQAVVSNLDKPPRELQEVLGKQRMILDQSSFPGDFMVEAQGAYLDLLGSLLDKKTNFLNSSVLDIILDESPVF